MFEFSLRWKCSITYPVDGILQTYIYLMDTFRSLIGSGWLVEAPI